MKTNEYLNDLYKWGHSVLGVTCISFFFALFSAGNEFHSSIALKISAYLFGIGLPTNTFFAFMYSVFGSANSTMRQLEKNTLFQVINFISMLLVILGILFLISYFSIIIAMLTLTTIIGLYLFLKKIIPKAIDMDLKKAEADFIEKIVSIHTEAGDSKEKIQETINDWIQFKNAKRDKP